MESVVWNYGVGGSNPPVLTLIIMTTIKKLEEEWMKNPSFREEYEKMRPEFEELENKIKLRKALATLHDEMNVEFSINADYYFQEVPYTLNGQDFILTDISSVPFHMRMDYITRNENIVEGNVLCKHCNGTGNEFSSMYRQCPICYGEGHIEDVAEMD